MSGDPMPSHEELGSDFVSIAVADSTRIHTQLLADALRKDRGLQVVAEASSSKELLAAITRVPIDVAVISHNLDEQAGRGTEVLRQIRALRPQIKGVILVDSSKPHHALDCFRAGARGIFSKHEPLESLCKCIRDVHAGQIWARSEDLDHALEALANTPQVRATNHKGIELLTSRERQVVQHMSGGMTNREIAQTLHLSPHTVKNYLFRIFDKLGVSSRTELLYLTMNNEPTEPESVTHGYHKNVADMESAEGGDPSAQIRMGDYYCQDIMGCEPEPVSAYMWYLLAEISAGPLLKEIEERKKNISQTMTTEQVAEATSRAAAWLSEQAKEAGSGDDGDEPDQNQKKMHAGA
jgi:DNA-binding NarL/FixJ family response regulator